MKKLASLLIAASALVGFAGIAQAEATKDAKPFTYSFEGPFGKFDKAQLQRGYKVKALSRSRRVCAPRLSASRSAWPSR